MAVPYSRYLIGSLPWYSVLVVAGMAAAIALCMKEERRLGLPKDTALDLALWVIPVGVLGARIYYVVFTWEHFSANPLSVFAVWQGGLAIYGGIIAGFLTVVIFALCRHLSTAMLTDMVVPGVALAQAIGRWGNYFNQEAYGGVIENTALQFFPAGVLIAENGTLVWHQATFFYESAWNLLVFVLLWTGRRKRARPGDTTLWYLLLYSAGRVLIEGLRTDSLMAGSLRISQVLSAVMLAAVPLFFILRLEQKKALQAELCLAAMNLALWWLMWCQASVLLCALSCLGILLLTLYAERKSRQ